MSSHARPSVHCPADRGTKPELISATAQQVISTKQEYSAQGTALLSQSPPSHCVPMQEPMGAPQGQGGIQG